MEPILYILLLVAIVFSLIAQIKVSSTFRKYSRVATAAGKRAEEVARMLLDREGLYDVTIERVNGNLTDHYDPKHRVLRLSESVYGNASAAAIGVACHEAGHAIQHAHGYAPLKLRSALVPVTNFASRAWWWIVVLGGLLMFFGELAGALGYYLILGGIALFSVTTLFQLVTLPCEFNASHRAMEAMASSGYFERSELGGARRVLSAAAMTYVAAALVSLLQLLRFIAMFRRSD